jgi:hypothetical protein
VGQNDIKKALIKYLKDLSLPIPLNYPNTVASHTTPPYGDVSVVFSDPKVATLGDQGEDDIRGFMQISLYTPLSKGDEASLAYTDTIRANFKAGFGCAYGDQKVTFINSGGGNGNSQTGKYFTPITIYWYARTRR